MGSALQEVSIRPIKCRAEQHSGYSILVSSDIYSMIVLKPGTFQPVVVGDRTQTDAGLKQISELLYYARSEPGAVCGEVRRLQTSEDHGGTSGYGICVHLGPWQLVPAGQPHNEGNASASLIVVDLSSDDKIAPKICGFSGEAQAIAAAVMEMLGAKIDWARVKIVKSASGQMIVQT